MRWRHPYINIVLIRLAELSHCTIKKGNYASVCARVCMAACVRVQMCVCVCVRARANMRDCLHIIQLCCMFLELFSSTYNSWRSHAQRNNLSQCVTKDIFIKSPLKLFSGKICLLPYTEACCFLFIITGTLWTTTEPRYCVPHANSHYLRINVAYQRWGRLSLHP
jgi:hypothetical protein